MGDLAGDAGLLIAARAAQGLAAILALPRLPPSPPRCGKDHSELVRWRPGPRLAWRGGTAGNLIGGVLTECLS
ncbi:hypothetical protein [Kibdelosporangium aridum]|uniref:hypothetical protein n=1 Tax=Kibdelosporangium aridum TaxID=2030 RepID=UPI000691641E|nr:hypothetical protein [Kibdelosporangium aridum]